MGDSQSKSKENGEPKKTKVNIKEKIVKEAAVSKEDSKGQKNREKESQNNKLKDKTENIPRPLFDFRKK